MLKVKKEVKNLIEFDQQWDLHPNSSKFCLFIIFIFHKQSLSDQIDITLQITVFSAHDTVATETNSKRYLTSTPDGTWRAQPVPPNSRCDDFVLCFPRRHRPVLEKCYDIDHIMKVRDYFM